MKLIILGPPGSGKGTQANFIKKNNGIPQISTGDLLRAAVKNRTKLGLKAKEFMNTGKLVPDDIVLKLLKERITKNDCEKGFILDGYPRNINQAQQLEKITDIDLVINIEVDFKLLIERITGRRTCRQCGAIFHVKYKAPKSEGVCDICSGTLFQRDDDTEETVKKRIETYNAKTKPLIDFYERKENLKTLKSDGTIEEMRQKVIELLSSYLST
ncbi:MAG: adenylate kinase [Candidatus Hodarchaeota archaeon]